MESNGASILKGLKPIFIIFICGFILLGISLYFSSPYIANNFYLKLNGKDMEYKYNEVNNNGLFNYGGGRGSNCFDRCENELFTTDQFIIEILETEVYKNDGKKVDGTHDFNKNMNYKQVEIIPRSIKLCIKLDDIIVYNGDFTNNITKYIMDPGNYKLEITSKRKNGWFGVVTTKIEVPLKITEKEA